MPITQSRMLSLIAAAQDYRQALNLVMEFADAQRANVLAGKITPEQGFDLLVMNTQPSLLLAKPIESALVIIEEAKHFRRSKGRNTRKAEKLRVRREEQRLGLRGAAYPSSAPSSILETDAIAQAPLQRIQQLVLDEPGAESEFSPKTPMGAWAQKMAQRHSKDEDEFVLGTEGAPPPDSLTPAPPLVDDSEIEAMMKLQERLELGEQAAGIRKSLPLISDLPPPAKDEGES